LTAPEPPRETFAETPHIIDDSNRRVELHFFGSAHTRGDGFAYLPKEKVLCTGDAVVNGPFNYTGDGYVANWPKVMDRAAQLDVVHVLPGHGAPGGKDLIAGQKRFFVELRQAVDAGMKDGKDLDELTSLKLPAAVSNWVGDGFGDQVKVVYEELRQDKPHGEILGGK
ncbi:MAG: MBL fold metallo-hydrolase, partial [bacterium]|nr:MBL fold metallo-hydrolase [bacterium]